MSNAASGDTLPKNRIGSSAGTFDARGDNAAPAKAPALAAAVGGGAGARTAAGAGVDTVADAVRGDTSTPAAAVVALDDTATGALRAAARPLVGAALAVALDVPRGVLGFTGDALGDLSCLRIITDSRHFDFNT
jgi:hypothetical protein